MHTQNAEETSSATRLFRRILVATDFSPASTPAFEQSIKIAKASGAQLLITHAYEMTKMVETGYVSAQNYEQWNEQFRAGIQSKLEPLVERARQEGIDAAALVLVGLPDVAILEAAKERDADLIVMGTHGRRGLSRLFLGSVASRVIPSAPCPVLAVRCA